MDKIGQKILDELAQKYPEYEEAEGMCKSWAEFPRDMFSIDTEEVEIAVEQAITQSRLATIEEVKKIIEKMHIQILRLQKTDDEDEDMDRDFIDKLNLLSQLGSLKGD